MKKILAILLSAFVASASAQHINLSGSIPELAGKKLVLQYLDHFASETPVDAAGKFNTDLTLPAGYYSFKGTDVVVYLEPGMQLSVTKTGDRVDFAGKGSAENKVVKQVMQLAGSYFPLKHMYLGNGLNFTQPDAFLAKVNSYKYAAVNLVNNASVSAYFKSSQVERITYLGKRLSYDFLGRYGIDSVKELQAGNAMFEYLKTRKDTTYLNQYRRLTIASHVKTMSAADSLKLNVLANFDTNNELAYRSSEDYRNLLKSYYGKQGNIIYAKDNSITGKALSDRAIIENIKNPFIIEEMQFQYVLGRFHIKRDKDKTYQEYIASATNPNYINDIKSLYFGTKLHEGTLSPDFVFTDVKGAKVSLASMRGSYVYIDFWATYCVSCMSQMPALKNLETKLEGKNIRFVGVSVDRKQDELKWKKFIAANKLKGTQLIVYNGQSAFTDFFKVSGIPRFILIDPNGVVISEDALRPDEKDLQIQLEKLLAKN